MFESLSESMRLWHKNNDGRAKLQHTFLTVTIVLVLAAGLIGLINPDLGQNILSFALVTASVFLINAVVWALLESAVLARLGGSNRRPTVAATARSRKK